MKPLLLIFLAFAAAQGADTPPKLEDVPFQNGGFELPKVTARTAEPKGANPALPAVTKEDERAKQTAWAHFMTLGIPADKPGDGTLAVGLTNELAHTGKQSVFVDFQKLKTNGKSAFLSSELVPVKQGGTYRVSVWGRIDRKRPLTLDQRRPFMQVEVSFFKAGAEEQAGEADVRTQMIPGKLDRLVFVAGQWSEFFTTFRAPDEAALMQVTFRWQTPNEAGTTDGLIYFDDAAIAYVVGHDTLAPPTAESETGTEEKSEEAKPEEGKPKTPQADEPKR